MDRCLVRAAIQITGDFAKHVLIAGLFEIGFHDLNGVGLGVCTCSPQQFAAARFGLELHLCIMGTFGFKCVFTVVHRAYGGIFCVFLLYPQDMVVGYLARKGCLS